MATCEGFVEVFLHQNVLEEADHLSQRLELNQPFLHQSRGLVAQMRHELLLHIGKGLDCKINGNFRPFAQFGWIQGQVLRISEWNA